LGDTGSIEAKERLKGKEKGREWRGMRLMEFIQSCQNSSFLEDRGY
jgi:hypothetical protein